MGTRSAYLLIETKGAIQFDDSRISFPFQGSLGAVSLNSPLLIYKPFRSACPPPPPPQAYHPIPIHSVMAVISSPPPPAIVI